MPYTQASLSPDQLSATEAAAAAAVQSLQASGINAPQSELTAAIVLAIAKVLLSAAFGNRTMLLLRSVDNNNARVLYLDKVGNRFCFVQGSRNTFVLHCCTDSGEPMHPLDHGLFSVDYLPESDNATATAFRPWATSAGIKQPQVETLS